jgi:uncharacterized membrane protein YfcA
LITLIVVFAGALAGGFVAGLAGFGTGITALGIWLYVVEPAQGATLVVLCSVVSQVQTIPTIWHAIDRRRVLPFIVPGLIGVPLGTLLLEHVSPDAFRLAIGGLLLAFSTFMLCGRRLHLRWGGRVADGFVGFFGGILGGLAGLSGPLPTMWATLRKWGKDERRSVFQAFNLTVLVAALVMHAAAGLLTLDVWRLFLAALPGTILGAWLGARTYLRLSDKNFHDVVLCLLAFSGVVLIWSSL